MDKISNIDSTKDYYKPIFIDEYYIYDIFHNDNEQIIIISPSEINPLLIKLYYNNIYIDFTINICPHNHTYIYICSFKHYLQEICLNINNKNINVNVNKYPVFKNEIIMSTEVKNEDEYIIQWINYHKLFGITRFIIYDNSNNYNLGKLLEKYILDKTVVLFEWRYKLLLPISGRSGQTTQQNHCIYAFQQCKYIGLFDIDEYINPQINNITNINDLSLDNLFNNIIFNNGLNINNIGGFTLLNKDFLNPNNLDTDKYNFLNIYNCDNIVKSGREKNFIIPKNVNTFSIHMITKGKETYRINENIIYFNHYIFLNKLDRGKYITNIVDISIKNKIQFL